MGVKHDFTIPFSHTSPSQVTTVAADQSFTIRDLASGAVKLNVERCSLGRLTRRGLYLAFHNPGACVALVSVRVFYQRCPEAVQGLARFPDTLPGPGGLVEVAGTCLPHAQASPGPAGAPRMHCSPEGEWLVPVGRCHCEPGYEEGSSGEGCLGKEAGGGGGHLQGSLGGGPPGAEGGKEVHAPSPRSVDCVAEHPRRHMQGASGTEDWRRWRMGMMLPVNTLANHGSAAFSLQPALAAPTGQTQMHHIVSSVQSTAQPSPRGPPSAPVRAAISEPRGRAPKWRARVSPRGRAWPSVRKRRTFGEPMLRSKFSGTFQKLGTI